MSLYGSMLLFAAELLALPLGVSAANSVLPPFPQTAHSRFEWVRRSQPLLGTFVTITACGAGQPELETAVTSAFAEIERIDTLLSVHRADTTLARANREAAAAPARVPAELLELLKTVWRIAEESEGAFDPTIGPLVELWGFLQKSPRLPEPSALESLRRAVGFRHVMLDRAASSIRFAQPGCWIDPGGFGKGYAVDKAIERLRAHGVARAMVKAGGDLRVIGAPPGASHWTVQIEDPAKSGRREIVMLRDAALSTSGNYENYFELDGKRYAHILDPRSGMPASEIASCTVIAPTCLETDAWATAFVVLGSERSLASWGVRMPIVFWVNQSAKTSIPPRRIESSAFKQLPRPP